MYINLSKNIQDILLSILLLFTSVYITKYNEISLLVLIAIILFITNIFYNRTFYGRYITKTAIVVISLFTLIYGLNYKNSYINNYSISLLMFINILILLETCYPFKTIFDYISLLGIILLLITFDFSKWKVKNMKLLDIDYNWIYLKTFVLTIMYVFSTCPANGYNLSLLLPLYAPFLFSLDEYVIHRTLFFGLGILYAYN